MNGANRSTATKPMMCIVAVVAAVAMLSGCDWTMYRSNAAHTGESVGERTIGAGNVASLAEAWSTDHDTAFDNVIDRDPVVAGGRMYVRLANGVLAAYDARGIENCAGTPNRCKPVWRAGGGSSPAVAGGVVYVVAVVPSGSSLESALVAYDAHGIDNCSGTPPTCQPLWTAGRGADISFASAPVVAGGIVFLTGSSTAGNVLYAFDAAGTQGCGGTPRECAPLWTASFGAAADINGGGGEPAVANGRVFVPGGDHTVHVFDAAGQQQCGGTPKSCTALWTAPVPLPCPASHSPCDISVPAVANGTLFVAGQGSDLNTGLITGGLYAFDAGGSTSCGGSPKLCTPLWQTTSSSQFAPAIANGVVYVVGNLPTQTEYRLRAFDAAGVNGCAGTPKVCSPLWTADPELVPAGFSGLRPGDGLTSAPAVANGVVYVVGIGAISCDIVCITTRHLYAFNVSGATSPVFHQQDGPGLQSFGEPVVANGTLYVTDAGLGQEGPASPAAHAFTVH